MATTQTVNIDINANTQGAEQSVSRLEQNIKTLDGAVNLVGGSIATLAGGLVLVGGVTEEQAEKFQSAAIGAIALAEGSKRALEGFKTLATETKVFTGLQRALNVVMAANPIYLVVAAVAALTAAYFALNRETKSEIEEQKTLNDELERQNTILGNTQNFYNEKLAILKASGVTGVELTKAEINALQEEAKLRREQNLELQTQLQGIVALRRTGSAEVKAQREADIKELEAELLRRGEAYSKLLSQIRVANATLNKELNDQQIEAAEKAAQDAAYAAAQSETKIELKKKEVGTIVEIEEQGAQLSINIQSQRVKKEVEIAKIEAAQKRKIAETEEAYKQALFTDGIDNLQGALSALFGENKAIASANVLIDAAQAGVAIIKNSQTTGPFAIAYQVTQFALLAATTIASLRQINAAEPGASGTPSFPKGGGIPASGGFGGMQTGGGGQVTVTPNTGFSAPPIRAYVVTGDVVTGMEAEAQLTTRRQFP